MLDPQLLASIGEAPDFDVLTARVLKTVHEFGFGLVSGVLIQGRSISSDAVVAVFGNPPEAYRERSKSLADGLRDPVLRKLLATPGFAWYDQSTYENAGVADLWDLQSCFGYKRGLAVSHHAPSHAEAFLLGVDGPDKLPANPVALVRLQGALQLVSLQAQRCVDRIIRPATVRPEARAAWAGTVRDGALHFAARGHLVKIEELRLAMRE